MPEFPDVTVYIEALEARILGAELDKIRLASPFLLRTVQPPILEVEGKKVIGLSRMGKRIVIGMESDFFLVIHLMIAGRLAWKDWIADQPRPKVPGRKGLAAFDFTTGTLVLTEAGSKKRASLHLVRGQENLRLLDPGGLEVLDAVFEEFRNTLLRENHTLKRALTDPRLFSGIGNAYSDEILHRARLSPIRLTHKMEKEEIKRLYLATRQTLEDWTRRLREEVGAGFPTKVTAFRQEMAVHGRYGKPCPECGTDVRRIVYASNETNYCATCQTGGRLLADRALSRLLKKDWPRTVEELEERLMRPEGTKKAPPTDVGRF